MANKTQTMESKPKKGRKLVGILAVAALPMQCRFTPSI